MKRVIVLLAALLAGCHPDWATFSYESVPPTNVEQTSGGLTLGEGSAVAIVPYFVHEEIEGTSNNAPDDVRSDDPSIATVSFTPHSKQIEYGVNARVVTVVGVRAGDTSIRMYRSGDADGEFHVHVVPQTP